MLRTNTRLVPEVENTSDTHFVPRVLERTTCSTHGADQGRGCWEINTIGSLRAPAVCNERALHAGMNSPISETAFVVMSKTKGSKRRSKQ